MKYSTASHRETLEFTVYVLLLYVRKEIISQKAFFFTKGSISTLLIGNTNSVHLKFISDPRCKTNIDECESSPCQYGGTCKDGIARYECFCIPGITGPNCETDIDECGSSPCQHGGGCIDHING